MKKVFKIIGGIFLLLAGALVALSQLYSILMFIEKKETPTGGAYESGYLMGYILGWIVFSAIAVVAIKYAIKLLRGGAHENQIDDDVLKNP